MNNIEFERKFRRSLRDLYNSNYTTRERSAILHKSCYEKCWISGGNLCVGQSYVARPWYVVPVVAVNGIAYGFDARTLEPWGSTGGVPDAWLPDVQKVIDYFRPQFDLLTEKDRLLKED